MKEHTEMTVQKSANEVKQYIAVENAQSRKQATYNHRANVKEHEKTQASVESLTREVRELSLMLSAKKDTSDKPVHFTDKCVADIKPAVIFPSGDCAPSTLIRDDLTVSTVSVTAESKGTLASSKKGSHAESVRNRNTFRQLSDKILDDNVRLEYECKYNEDKLKAFELPSKDSSRVIPMPQGMTTRAQKAREAHLENQAIGRRKEQQKKANNPLKG